MTPPRPDRTALPARRSSVLAVFAAVHVLAFVLLLPRIIAGETYGDVVLYRHWAFHGFSTGVWLGIDDAWVYPAGAMLPMIVAGLLGQELYLLGWFLLCLVLNLTAVLALLNSGATRYGWQAAYLWTLLTAILGPVAFARVDGVTGPLVVVGLICAAAHPVFASSVLSLATWIKVWPAAAVLALLITARARGRVVLAGLLVSGVIVGVAASRGGLGNVVGFLSTQGERGMQLEAPLATPGLWQAILGDATTVEFNAEIHTMEIRGSFAEPLAALMDAFLCLAVASIALLMVAALRKRADRAQLVVTGTLALVGALIVFNKVGSPQFMLWLVAVISVGAALNGRRWIVPSALMVLIAVLTTLVYPIFYIQLHEALQPGVALLLSARNLLVVVVFGWAVRQLRLLPSSVPGTAPLTPLSRR
ncbi:glycosyltransferase 87 family protein [Arthrobacter sp. L77]|uniref:glycosyltransferase 87 family protein n=1 Tax=Arthrobacter sp. L77 TaxID=1496689 RepID=UPI0005B9CCDF|nr:glycosyltransferase 87 family protein [Arthrobacter sp. L77]